MSTLKATNLQHASSATPNLVLAADGSVTGGLPYPNRNLLYNGAMQVAQRATSVASLTDGGYRTADRWYESINTLGTWTQSIENDAPTGSGFRKSLKVLCTTADAAPAAGDSHQIFQALEGKDLQRVLKGTSAAQQLTLSFWVKSSTTGTYVIELFDNDNSRQVSASYTISASGTWEKKTITFPADTTGAFDNDNARSLDVQFWLGAGSNFTSGTLNTSWAANDNTKRAVGQVNLAAATNNYWQVTGVQLEVGPVASAFEFKPYGQELRECQRYYWRNGYAVSGFAISTTAARYAIQYPVYPRDNATGNLTMVAAPTVNHPGGNGTPTGMTVNAVVTSGAYFDLTGMTGLTANQPNVAYGGTIAMSAEL